MMTFGERMIWASTAARVLAHGGAPSTAAGHAAKAVARLRDLHSDVAAGHVVDSKTGKERLGEEARSMLAEMIGGAS